MAEPPPLPNPLANEKSIYKNKHSMSPQQMQEEASAGDGVASKAMYEYHVRLREYIKRLEARIAALEEA